MWGRESCNMQGPIVLVERQEIPEFYSRNLELKRNGHFSNSRAHESYIGVLNNQVSYQQCAVYQSLLARQALLKWWLEAQFGRGF